MGVRVARRVQRWKPGAPALPVVLGRLFVVSGLVIMGLVASSTLTDPEPASAATRALEASSPVANGVWPGVGRICEPGPGGTSAVRGVGPKTVHIAVFNDRSNTVVPGIEKEFVQFADAFAAWCNASGGINGRHLVIDDRDGALFNAAQVTNESCQSDFMAVGGGLVLDAAAVPVREGCGLGQIPGYTVSDASSAAPLQVNPANANPRYVGAGWFAALAKKYPKAVQQAAMGAENNPNILEPEHKFEDAAKAMGWTVREFQTVPLSVPDWTPYVQDLQTKGIQADWPSVQANIAPYLQAMATTGYSPAFLMLGGQYYTASTVKALAGLHLPPVYVSIGYWPFERAAQNPSTEQLVGLMHRYAHGAALDFWDQEAASAWLLWAKAASACGAGLTVSCVLTGAQVKDWSAGGMGSPVSQLKLSNEDPVPSPCFALMRATPHGFVYDKAVTAPTESIWNCSAKNLVQLTPQQIAALSG